MVPMQSIAKGDRPRMRYQPHQYDSILDKLVEVSPNMMVPWFLMASYLYYHRDVSLLTDERYDRLCQDLQQAWPEVEHVHKKVISLEHLKAGTGYSIAPEDYPTICTHAATQLAGIAWVDHRKVTEIDEVPKQKFKVVRKPGFTITKKTGRVLVFGGKK